MFRDSWRHEELHATRNFKPWLSKVSRIVATGKSIELPQNVAARALQLATSHAALPPPARSMDLARRR